MTRDSGCFSFTLETIDTVDVFTRPVYKQIIVHSLNHFIDNKGLVVYGWVLMSSKLYMIVQAQSPFLIDDLQAEFQEFTCKKIIEAIKEAPAERKSWVLHHFEKHPTFDQTMSVPCCWGEMKVDAHIDMNDPGGLAEQLELIHSIPVKERIVQYPPDYIYSSARDYIGMPGLVKVSRPAATEKALYDIEHRKSGFRKNYS